MKHDRSAVDRRGFTLIELVIAMALISILALIGFPSLLNMIKRAKHETVLREAATMARSARLEAIKRSTTTFVFFNAADSTIESYLDADGDNSLDTSLDTLLEEIPLPPQIVFAKPAAADASTDTVAFDIRGSVEPEGKMRIADEALENFLEVHIAPKATARVVVRKWDTDHPDCSVPDCWFEQGESDVSWSWN